MRYIDMHCDTLTVCADLGKSIADCGLQTDVQKLNSSGCAAQCFALFTEGDGAALPFEKYLKFFKEKCVNSGILPHITRANQLEELIKNGKTGAILTVENLGFIGGDLDKLYNLKEAGVSMASLVWNNENLLAYPNLVWGNDARPLFEKRETRGLKPKGRAAVEILDSLKIIVDISHLSDGGAEEILDCRKTPAVASHSNAAAVCNVSRNLTDSLIRKIAESGGVIGINFCKDFLGKGDNFSLVREHIIHIVKIGGEEVAALGSDFDGIPPCGGLEDCTGMPRLFDFLSSSGFGADFLEKLAYKNFMRVFKDVCG